MVKRKLPNQSTRYCKQNTDMEGASPSSGRIEIYIEEGKLLEVEGVEIVEDAHERFTTSVKLGEE